MLCQDHKISKFLIFSFLLVVFATIKSPALSLGDYCRAQHQQSEKDFLNTFPYQDYLQQFAFGDLELMENHRLLLNKQGRSGDKFLFRLSQSYLIENPVKLDDLEDLKQKVLIGEAFARKAKESEEVAIYELLGNILLEAIAIELQKGIREQSVNPHDAEIQNLVTRLRAQQFIINIPKSNLEKLQYHLLQGHWAYLWDRLFKELAPWSPFWWLCPLLLGTIMINHKRIRDMSKRLFYQIF